jgi:mRNA interferase RelE/StbE
VASYRLLIKPSAVKELEALPAKDRRRLATRLQKLSVDPRPAGSEKLSGHDLYRIRQGNYRVLYSVHDRELVILVIKVGHRREVYRSP